MVIVGGGSHPSTHTSYMYDVLEMSKVLLFILLYIHVYADRQKVCVYGWFMDFLSKFFIFFLNIYERGKAWKTNFKFSH